jgi:excisionase family DNA binding protein
MEAPTPPADLIGMKTAARLAGVHLATAYRWAASGKLAAWRRCGHWYTSRAAVRDLFRTVPPRPAA